MASATVAEAIMKALVSDISEMSLMAAWVAAESEEKSGVEGSCPSGKDDDIEKFFVRTT